MIAAMALLAGTLTMTHHMSSYALLTFLAGWAALTALAARKADAGAARGQRRPSAASRRWPPDAIRSWTVRGSPRS